MTVNELPVRAAVETAAAHGITADRCEVLQNGSTLVLRLTETLVARVVQDAGGPRSGTAWFARENAVAQHLTARGAPVIPLHPDIPAGPHEHLGFPLNFWEFVTVTDTPFDPAEAGRTLHRCHRALESLDFPLPRMAILTECLEMLDPAARKQHFPAETVALLRRRLTDSLAVLDARPHQALHGDAHPGNLMNTTRGLLWTDWEDAFSGPVEWDLACAVWNARLLDGDHPAADAVIAAYEESGGAADATALHHSLIARAAVMSAWYPVLYPNPGPERLAKLRHRLTWLEHVQS